MFDAAIALPVTLHHTDGQHMILRELTATEPNSEFYNYACTVIENDEAVGQIESSCHYSIVAQWFERHAVITGDYDYVVHRPIRTEWDEDTGEIMAYIFIPESSTDAHWGTKLFVDGEPGDDELSIIDQYLNEMFVMDVFGVSVQRAGAIPSSRPAITIREFIARSTEKANNWEESPVSAVARTLQEYNARLDVYIRTGRKYFGGLPVEETR